MTDIPARLDHVIYATPRLDDTLRWFEAETGARPWPGGTHPAWHTRNAIVPLSRDTYLEIIGPDDATPEELPQLFGIAALQAPHLVTWVAKGTDLPELVKRARAQGIELGEASCGGRRRPDGSWLSWQFTDPLRPRAGGLVPLFIDWGDSPHPAAAGEAGVTLQRFYAEHPSPAQITSALQALGLDLPVMRGPLTRLIALLTTPKGTITLS